MKFRVGDYVTSWEKGEIFKLLYIRGHMAEGLALNDGWKTALTLKFGEFRKVSPIELAKFRVKNEV